MADERDPAAEDSHRDDATGRTPVDEHTSRFDPFTDDDHDDDADIETTRAMPADGDATRAMPADGEVTRAMPVDGDATRAMPADAEVTQKVAPHVWAARAAVPLSGPETVSGPVPAQWQEGIGDENADRSWLRPVVIALVVLILLAMLGIGLWLIFNRSGGRSAPAPGVTVTPSGIATPTATLPATETPAAPTTAPTTAVTQVAVPDLVGQSEASAKQQLTAKGLAFTVSRRAASGVNAGTVIATEPGPGAMVAPGTQVTLVVAAAPAATTPTPARSPSTSPRPTASPSASRVP
jgi:hypothetical protein